MSIFYCFISSKPLPKSAILRAYSIHYSLSNITKYVRDAKENHFYYDCNPAAIYTTEPIYDIDKIISVRETMESNYLLWLAKEFARLGEYRFIRLSEDNAKCQTGHFETYFQKCRNDYMSYSEFYECIMNDEEGIETDVIYTIKENNDWNL